MPGSGRKRGTPNRITVEARTLVQQLVNDPEYQHRLRTDFRRRRVHPTIESLVWQFHIGKPVAPVAITGGLQLEVAGRLEDERRIFERLDVADLELLAAESQALVDRARMLATKAGQAQPLDVVVEVERGEDHPTDGSAAESDPN